MYGRSKYAAMQITCDEFDALAGPLREIFAVDVTIAVTQCVACGQMGRLAALRVYSHAPGLVARCDGYDEVVLRLVRDPARAWLDLRGRVRIRIPLPDNADR